MPLIQKLPALQDPRARRYAFQLMLASVTAMAIANLLGLVNPWWAAMAVWMISQPTRGLLLERSAAQFIGTCVGAAMGVALMGIPDETARLGCLLLWLALCGGAANLMRHQRAYGGVMSGLTAAVVVIMSAGMDPARFAAMRVVDTAIGVLSAVFFIALWSPKGPGEALLERARSAGREALSLAGLILEPGEMADWLPREQRLLAELAMIEAVSEDAVSGSIGMRRRLRPLRGLLASLLDVIAAARVLRERAERHQNGPQGLPAQALLQDAGLALARYAQSLSGDEAMRQQAVEMLGACARSAEAQAPVLAHALQELQAAMAAAHDDYLELAALLPGGDVSGFALSMPNWAGARLAVLRSLAACLLPMALWLATGSELARYVMLGGCVFTTVFAAADDPALILRQALIGAMIAVAGAVVWRAGLMHVLDNGYESLLLAVPFIFVSGAVQAHRPTAFVGLALNMVFAVMAQPVQIHAAQAEPVALTGLALLAGLLFSLACFRWVVPMSSTHRRRHLREAMRKEIGAVSARAGDPRAARHLARLRYLALDLLSRAGTPPELTQSALSALVLGHTLLRIGSLAQGADMSAPARQAARAALDELRRTDLSAGYLGASLMRYAMQVESSMVMTPGSILPMQELGQSLRDASACIDWQPAFLID